MMNTELQQTEFHIEKLKNVVNVSGASAYQIFTYPGPVIGRITRIKMPEIQKTANDADFNSAMTVQRPANWIQRTLSALRG